MATAAPTSRPILELATLAPIERPYITIDGARYDLLVPADFSLLSLNHLDQMAARVDALQKRQDGPGPLSDADAGELTEALKTVVAQILRAPVEVLDKLSDVQRLMVLTAFTPGSPESTPPANRKTRRARRTGATSSRGSRASTAAATG